MCYTNGSFTKSVLALWWHEKGMPWNLEICAASSSWESSPRWEIEMIYEAAFALSQLSLLKFYGTITLKEKVCCIGWSYSREETFCFFFLATLSAARHSSVRWAPCCLLCYFFLLKIRLELVWSFIHVRVYQACIRYLKQLWYIHCPSFEQAKCFFSFSLYGWVKMVGCAHGSHNLFGPHWWCWHL